MKILVVRFSSIGDIVLTSSVMRCLKEQLPNSEIHFLTKAAFRSVVEHNPNIDKVITIDSSIKEVTSELKNEKYDHIVDLHNNLRTRSLALRLRRPTTKFPKLNWEKWKLVKFKSYSMPDLHVVDRYFEAVESLGVKSDGKKGDFKIPESEVVDVQSTYKLESGNFIALVIGAKFGTKQLPINKLVELIDLSKEPVVLIGGPDDVKLGEEILAKIDHPNTFNSCGKHSILGSASILKQSRVVVTNDTGMMHIAACFDVPIVSIWGNTFPELGMYPYRPNDDESYSIHEVKDLNCRPCSKIGYAECPKGHFDCMMKQDVLSINTEINEI
ncbi:MAG: glycosyltransferase family 9 protein [Crocinitomicaceae bacterium]|nr:glycosyltransferase family 9 protein [Crocinitomicaceae bacterium]